MSIEDPHDVLNTVNLVTQCLCIPIVTIFVAMRFSIRAWYKQWAPVEDWTCLFAWMLFMAYCGVAIEVGNYGGGYHYYDLSDETLVLFRKMCYVATVLYCPMALLVKIALLSIIIRIFSPYKNRILFIYVFLGALCIYYIIAEIVKIRMCDPVPAYWKQDDPNASCLDQRAALIADSVISVVSDLLILILPLPLTWSLQMSRNKKLRVIGMLSAGGLATAFSIYRLILVLRDGSSPDMTIVFTCVIMSGNAEGGVGLICACLPSLNIIITKMRNHSYKSRYYEQHASSVQLSRVRGNTNKGISQSEPENNGLTSDESHLISYAGAVERSHMGPRGGIHKTVDVEQTIEMVDGTESEPRRSNL
ncbi:hypothetical protein ASPCAL13957 [Aspergillus calidoustus]|uniref:Rhodopsin domain-containing protein n=2 Tax=Aspergillus calidoustus TaxID=454130 RepID=A0A0U5GGL8_ASPCI|nr:hypothetical protein ASPCAL13957 [Aspergillus calidoustus]